MLSLILVAAGGAVGAACRYGAGLFFTVFFGGVFPLGTLFVNVAGCYYRGDVFSSGKSCSWCAGHVSHSGLLRRAYHVFHFFSGIFPAFA